MTVINVTEATFERDVVERSFTTPVLIDFWAGWCQPCKQLTPILERAVASAGGDVVLAKVDVDANPALAREFRVQGIPAVKAVKDGKVVSEFTGVQPESQVRALVDSLRPSEGDKLAAGGDEASFRAALAVEPNHPVAVLGLARILADSGDDEAAKELLRRVPATAEVEKLSAEIELRELSDEATESGENADPASAALARGDYASALEHYLAAVRATKDETAREAMLRLFTVLGNEDPLVSEYRRKLASALF